MPTVFDVPSDLYIQKLSDYLRTEFSQIVAPPWASFVKTGVHTERQPESPDWWHVRAASLARKVYLEGPVGIARLRHEYGGRKTTGSTPYHKKDSSGNVLRKILQQLESVGLVEKKGNKGRVITDKGRAILDTLSAELKKELDKDVP